MANTKRAGRRGAAEVTRNLLDLASSLSEPGDYVSEEAIQKRFGCNGAQAAKLYALLGNVAGDPNGITAYEDEDGLAVGANGARGRALRLDATETFALVSALQRLGVGEDHPLRRKLQGSLAANGTAAELASRMLAVAPGVEVAEKLSACSAAMAALQDLEFEYHKVDKAPELRRVRPMKLLQEDGAWYLRGIDLDKRAERLFRLDRMLKVAAIPRREDEQLEPESSGEAKRIELVFYDKHYLDLFFWPGLHVDSESESDEVTGTLPYFGGMWLPRQIAGCGGAVEARDEEVAALFQEYAAAQFSDAD